MLAGFGHVGKAFFGLVRDKGDVLKNRYGLDLQFQAILKSDGGLISDAGITPRSFPEESGTDLNLSPIWRPGLSVQAAFRIIRPGVFVDCTPSGIRTGEPGLGYIRTALKAGWHVVTANKGPFVADFKGLRDLARRYHVSLKYSAATAAALPTLDVAICSLAGTTIQSIEGILNGTSNYVLTRMGEGEDYAAALKEAQDKGIAEPNPENDVKGWDTAVKLLLIANSALGLDLTLQEIKVKGITRIGLELMERAKRDGKAIKLIGRMIRAAGSWKAEVSPRIIDRSHPLFGVNGTNKGITFSTDTMGNITVTGGRSDPRGAAAALLKDIIHIFSPLP